MLVASRFTALHHIYATQAMQSQERCAAPLATQCTVGYDSRCMTDSVIQGKGMQLLLGIYNMRYGTLHK